MLYLSASHSRITINRIANTAAGLFMLLVMVVGISRSAAAQGTTARISGTIVDESGAIVPGVQVTGTNEETGATRTVLSDQQGRFVIAQLPPGPYQLRASMTGFDTLVRNGITLSIGSDSNLSLQMRVGGVTEQVTVTEEAPLINTTGSSVSGVVEEKRIEELPLNGRDFTKLALVQPGVILARKTDDVGTKGYGTRISMAGSRVDQTAWFLDGTNIKGAAIFGVPGSASGLVLGVDAVREFQVLTSNLSAEFGGTSGGVVNMVSKSGTNVLHGSLYAYHRNDNFDARNFFDRDPGNPLVRSNPPEFKRNQFGGSAGGPISKDRTFFFGNYEGLRERLGQTRTARVPDQNAHQGIVAGTGTITVAAAIRPFLDTYPLPNGRSLGAGVGELISPVSVVTDENYFITRVDHRLDESQNLFGRFTFDNGSRVNPDELPLTNGTIFTRTRYSTIQYQRIFTPQFLATTRVAYNRSTNRTTQNQVGEFPAATFLLSQDLPSSVSFTGASTLGPNDDPIRNVHNLYQFSEDAVYTLASHSLKFGADFQKLGMNYDGGNRAYGSFSWGNLQQFLTDATMQTITVGIPGSSATRTLRQKYFGIYIQDDWRVASHLTVNLGLRYDPYTVPTEKWGRLATLRDWRTATQFETDIPFFDNFSKKNFSPRAGFAWDPRGNGRTSLRGGVGLFYVPVTGPHYRTQSFRNQPFFAQLLEPQGGLSTVVADVARVGPSLQTTRLTTNSFIQLPEYYLKSPYEIKMNLTAEHELLSGLFVGLGYLGGRGFHLWRLDSCNTLPPSFDAEGRAFVIPGPRPNPIAGRCAINYSDAQSFYNGLQVEVKRRFSHGFQFQSAYTWSKTMDDSTSGVVSTDYGEGGSSQPYSTKADRGLSALHVGQNLVVNGIYAVPGFKSGMARWVLGGWQISNVFSAASGIPFSATSSGTNAPDLNRSTGRQRPDLLAGRSNDDIVHGVSAGCTAPGGVVTIAPGTPLGTPDLYFDPCAFFLPPPGYYGNAGRNIMLGPGLLSFDLSLQKTFPLSLREGTQLEFRGDLFNLFNHANFGSPSEAVLNPTNRRYIAGSGLITKTVTSARQLQLGLRLTF
jgi:outer membrane receptor protein involved in Fe transport